MDTIVALEALVTYSYNNRINDITELNVEVNLPDSNITENVAVSGRQALGISRLRTINIPNVWGTLNVHASGAGQAVVQLDTNHGIDYEPYKVMAQSSRDILSHASERGKLEQMQ